MNKLIVLQGCPCSGKTTWTKNYIEEVDMTAVVVCRDDIRMTVGGGEYTMENEKIVSEIEVKMIREAIANKHDVIIDATNLNPKTIAKWEALSKELGCEIEYVPLYIPYKEAMKRSESRKAAGGLYIPKKVMQRFYKQYCKEKYEAELTDYRVNNTIPYQNGLLNCVICDLDGTLAEHTGREPFEWDRIPEDKIDWRMRDMLITLSENHTKIFFLTGRPENVREQTELWLNENYGGAYTLIMRPEKQFGKGNAVKKELYEQHIKGKYNVIAVLEDSNSCVEMWRNEGLLTLQPQNSDY
jgi:predicted kinase